MKQAQLILSLIIFLPFLNAFFLLAKDKVKILSVFFNRFCSVFFAAALLGISWRVADFGVISLNLLKLFDGNFFTLAIDKNALKLLFLLSFLWLIFAFYGKRLFLTQSVENKQYLQLFFVINIGFLSLIILSQSSVALLLFYNFSLIISCLFSLRFLHKKPEYFSAFFITLFCLKILLFFIALLLTYNMIDGFEFGKASENLHDQKFLLLFLLYFLALFLTLLSPLYLLFQRHLNLEPLLIYLFFFIAFFVTEFLVLIKVLNEIFTLKNFAALFGHKILSLANIFFVLVLSAYSLFLIFSKNLKSSFFYLFFQHFIFTLFVTLLFAKFYPEKIYLPFAIFCLEFTLLFLTISNLALYFSKADEKSFTGLFYEMPLTLSLLIFVFASMIGFAPTLAIIQQVFLIKIAFKESGLIAVFVLINALSLIIFFTKSLRFAFLRSGKALSAEDKDLAKDIDSDSNLILTAFAVAIIMFFTLIFNPF